MAKKKRGMPSKTCINPECGATIHARSGACPQCGTEQPSKSEAVTAKESAPARSKRRAASSRSDGGLPEAVTFVRQVGSLDRAKSLLRQIEEIKKL